MQKKSAFLIRAIAAMMTFGLAFAQSSYAAGHDTKFELRSGEFRLGVDGQLQHMTRFTYDTNAKTYKFGFSLPQARVGLHGTAFHSSISYLFQAQFDGDSNASLRDYYVNLACDQDYFHVRIGKFRTPFSRQQLISTAHMQFADHHSAHSKFGLSNAGRDIGFMFHNGLNGPFEWALAVVSNGIAARLGYNHGGIDAYQMSDFDGGDFRMAIGASGFMRTDYKSFNTKDLRAGVDFVAKVAGFAANAAFYWHKNDANMKNVGIGLDMGYLVNKRFEPVVRVAATSADLSKFDIEAKAGVNYYAYGHNVKFQLAGGTMIRNNKDIDGINVGLQVQLAL